MPPPHGALQRAADDEVDLPNCATAERPTLMARFRLAIAERSTSLETRVEPLEQLGVELRRGQVAEGRGDVDPDQVLVSLPGRVRQVSNVEPLGHGLPDSDSR